MAVVRNFLHSSSPSSSSGEEYEFLSGTDREEDAGNTFNTVFSPMHVAVADGAYPGIATERSSSESSTSSATPTPSRVPSPSPFRQLSSSSPQADGEPTSPLLGTLASYTTFRDRSRRWWNLSPNSRRRRKREGRIWRTLKKGVRRVVRHPLFPQQPITIIFALLLLTVFAISLTLLLMYILNPDKEPLPWQAYCSIPPTTSLSPSYRAALPYPYINPIPDTPPPSFPPHDLDALPPAGIFVGVFSMDSALERRMLIRTTWASHPRSRNGAGTGDGGLGTSRTIVRFVLGQPRKGWERRIQTEMELYRDIVILPSPENMNAGKSHAYFSWAAENSWVPPLHFSTSTTIRNFSYSNQSTSAPHPAPHDPRFAWEEHTSGHPKPWVRPDYVVKVDDDAFVMLAELESRMRLELYATGQSLFGFIDTPASASHVALDTPEVQFSARENLVPKPNRTALQDPLVYWGYLVKERFMAGELYGLSWSLVDWVSQDPIVKGLTKGAEDKQTARWMALHPQAAQIRWASERCWIYDHPRSGTVYSHGFLFPSHVTRVKQAVLSYMEQVSHNHSDTSVGQKALTSSQTPTPSSWAYSSVSTFGAQYQQPLQDMTLLETVEALVEGSAMSKLRDGVSTDTDYAWRHREGRIKRYENKRVGGTVVVHFIKKHMWFLETALAFLEADDYSESECEALPVEADKEKLNVGSSAVWTDTMVLSPANSSR